MTNKMTVTTLIVALMTSPAAALADDPNAGASAGVSADVLTRPRPEYDAQGLRIGSFFLYPSLTGEIAYTDNVFNDSLDVDDVFWVANPQVKLRSGWSRHELNLSAESKTFWYDDQSSEDRTDWKAAGDARIDIMRGTDISGEGHYIDFHEPRGTDLTGGLVPGDPAEPTELAKAGGSLEFVHSFNRLRVSLGGAYDDVDYEDTPIVGGGFFNNDDRDHQVWDAFLKAAVEVSDDTAFFVRGRWTDANYDTLEDITGLNRDSDGWGVDGGFEFSMTHLLVGEVYGGYLQREYDDPAFGDAEEAVFGAGLRWFPSQLTTVRLDAKRAIEQTSVFSSSGYVSTRGELGIDHELMRNFILSGRVGFENAEYQEIAQDDDIVRASLSGRFLINNNFHCDLGWQYINRDSNVAAFDYETNQVMFSLTVKR